MKSLTNTTYFSIILVSLMLITSNILAASNSSTSDDQWIAHCLTTQDAGKDTDECLDMGGIFQSQQYVIASNLLLTPLPLAHSPC